MIRTVAIDEQAALAVAAKAPAGKPVVMINMLRFRDQADYGDRAGIAPCTGREAFFERYATVALPLVMAGGGKTLWMGDIIGNVIAPPEEKWDVTLLVEYPSFSRLQTLFANPEYQAIIFHRTAALEDSRLIASNAAEIDSP